MCYHPITIVNPTKYVSLKYRDRFLLQVPCGKCAQCQQRKVNEYYYRAYHQCIDSLSHGGFVLFDTLSYNDKYLPHITDFVQTKYDFSCFNSKHVRDFMKKLRQRCLRKFKSNFTYFLTSEYGTSDYYNYHGRIRKATHRPHYHVLFFVNGNIKPLEFSALVADCWSYGMTDGLPYKGECYVRGNVLNVDLAKSIKVLKYVSKYISKTSSFQKEIDKRIRLIMYEIAEKMPNGWIDSFNATLVKEKIVRNINQFHRQSTHFGESALSSMDLNEVMTSGKLSVVDNKKIVMSIPLPTYYKRKLFYKLVYVDNAPLWTPTEFGYEYLKQREKQLFKDLKNRYEAALYQANIRFDIDKLVDYVNNKRGRIKANLPESTLEERLSSVTFYKYATRYDRDALGKLGLFRQWLGNSRRGYERIFVPKRIPLQVFADNFTYHDDEMEKILDKIADAYQNIDIGKQQAYELRQHLTNLYKYLSS